MTYEEQEKQILENIRFTEIMGGIYENALGDMLDRRKDEQNLLEQEIQDKVIKYLEHKLADSELDNTGYKEQLGHLIGENIISNITTA